jgi:hypothetical protein
MSLNFLSKLDEAICSTKDLTNWLDNVIKELKVQEIAVNSSSTFFTITSIVSTVFLFTPLAPVGVAGLVGSGVGGIATSVGDTISNTVKGKMIKNKINRHGEIMGELQSLLKEIEEISDKLALKHGISKDLALQYVMTTGKTSLISVGSIAPYVKDGITLGKELGNFSKGFQVSGLNSFSFVMLEDGTMQLVRSGVSVAAKAIAVVGSALSLGLTLYGWINGNSTRNKAIDINNQLKTSLYELKNIQVNLQNSSEGYIDD